jgi:uncharacterized membrane protein YgdD (TMEM256/DUF423 family)
MTKNTFYIAIGALFGLLAVICGAFGAHALKAVLTERGTLEVWKTAVDYQMWHALALLLGVALSKDGKLSPIPGYSFILGILLFSGSLYWLALGGPAWLGPITPLGGLLLMIGWGSMGVSVWRSGRRDE